jgi:hypothetical protein
MILPRIQLVAICSLLGLLAGCTHNQLRRNAVNQAMSVGDMQTQQVMNNLAMFVYDYNSMPYFAYPNQGASIVTDQGSGGLSINYGRPITGGSSPTFTPAHFGDFMLNAIGLSGNAQRSCQESYTLTPVNDPRKLELMRCAYQTAVANCGYGPASRGCPDCQARFNTFYTGDPEGKINQVNSGIITSECLKGPCWFHACCDKDVPKLCPCTYVGKCCGVSVWVGPEGRDELTKLTLAILDYATHEPPARLSKDVTYYVDALGLPTTQKDSVGTVRATIGVNEQIDGLLNIPPAQEVELERQLQDRIKRLAAIMEQSKDNEQRKMLSDEIEDIKQKLYFLDQQLRNGGLKEQFSAPGPANAPPFSVIPQLQQQFNANSASPTLPAPVPQ